jgi:hypothetical protein
MKREQVRRMVSFAMLRRVALIRSDVSDELIASIVRVTRIMANVVPSSPILVNLKIDALSSSETLVLTRATRLNIPEDTILHSHRRENLKSYREQILLDKFKKSLNNSLQQSHSWENNRLSSLI